MIISHRSAAFRPLLSRTGLISRHSLSNPRGTFQIVRNQSQNSNDSLELPHNTEIDKSSVEGSKEKIENRKEWIKIDCERIPFDETVFSEENLQVFKRADLQPTSCPQHPSPVEKVMVRNKAVYFKRDDLLRLGSSNVSGNKARKLFALNEIPAKDFPNCVVSFGGPQSNAMLALAKIVNSKNDFEWEDERNSTKGREMKGELPIIDINAFRYTVGREKRVEKDSGKKKFVYFTKRIPRFLRSNPIGNYLRAISLGMEVVELSNDRYKNLFSSTSGGISLEAPSGLKPPVPGDSLWVPQGGACGLAVPGGCMLAKEIAQFWLLEGQGRPLAVCVPGGTCSTALVLHKEIKELVEKDGLALDIQVVVIPCVGDDTYARSQMMALNMETGGTGDSSELPQVLRPRPARPDMGESGAAKDDGHSGSFVFGEPNLEVWETFREMKASNGIVLDLLYGAPAWSLLLRHWQVPETQDDEEVERSPIHGREIMYVHSGGLEGIDSQLMRYVRKGLIKKDEIQKDRFGSMIST